MNQAVTTYVEQVTIPAGEWVEINHNLGTFDVRVDVFDEDMRTYWPSMDHNGINQIRLTMGCLFPGNPWYWCDAEVDVTVTVAVSG